VQAWQLSHLPSTLGQCGSSLRAESIGCDRATADGPYLKILHKVPLGEGKGLGPLMWSWYLMVSARGSLSYRCRVEPLLPSSTQLSCLELLLLLNPNPTLTPLLLLGVVATLGGLEGTIFQE
jgi:hypothetical protein